MAVKSYKELIVWQKSMDMVVEVYKLVNKLPNEELYSLSSQIRRAAVSVPSNIAEGQKRNSTKEFPQFLSFAKGSNAELQTQLLICTRLGFMTENDIKTAYDLTVGIVRMLNKIISTLK
ncbi:MAG: four helix bundle protein [Ruminococcus sp.]|nr:four helix bundle protein [Ruminococcus sp.]